MSQRHQTLKERRDNRLCWSGDRADLSKEMAVLQTDRPWPHRAAVSLPPKDAAERRDAITLCVANGTVKVARLNNTTFDVTASRSLNDALKATTNTILVLKLIGVGLGPEGMTAIALSLSTHPTLTTLDLTGNRLGPDGCSSLATALLRNKVIRSLNVSLNGIGDAGCEAVCSALIANSRTGVEELQLNTNHIGPESGRHIAEAMRSCKKLRSISAWRNELGGTPQGGMGSGVDAIFAVLAVTPTITHVDVTFNSVRDFDGRALVRACDAAGPLHPMVPVDPALDAAVLGRYGVALNAVRGRRVLLLRDGNYVRSETVIALSRYFQVLAAKPEVVTTTARRWDNMVDLDTPPKVSVEVEVNRVEVEFSDPDSDVDGDDDATPALPPPPPVVRKPGTPPPEVVPVAIKRVASVRRPYVPPEEYHPAEDLPEEVEAPPPPPSVGSFRRPPAPIAVAAISRGSSFVHSRPLSAPITDTVTDEETCEKMLNLLREMMDLREVIRALQEIGSPSDEDLQHVEEEKATFTARKGDAVDLLLAVPTRLVPTDDELTGLFQQVLVSILEESDAGQNNVRLLRAVLEKTHVDLEEILNDPGTLIAVCGDGNVRYLETILEAFTALRLDDAEVIPAACFSQTCRIPLVSMLLAHTSCLHLDSEEVQETVADTLQTFFEEIGSQKKLIPKEVTDGRLELMEALLTHPQIKINVSIEGQDGQTPLSRAARDGDVPLMKLLMRVRPDIDVDYVHTDGTNALIQAVMAKQAAFIESFLGAYPAVDLAHASPEAGTAYDIASILLRDKPMVVALVKPK